MAITYSLESWLNRAGYQYHCFISWAHTSHRDMSECAKQIKIAIEEILSYDIIKPKIFLDESEIFGGEKWEKKLEKAICKSVAMVSICAPIYCHPDKRWCGLEWAAMETISRIRLPDVDYKTIIPVVVRKFDPFPKEINPLQCIDFSHIVTRGRHYYRTKDFRKKIVGIVQRIEVIAEDLKRNECDINCEDFRVPETPAFSDYQKKDQQLPFRGN